MMHAAICALLYGLSTEERRESGLVIRLSFAGESLSCSLYQVSLAGNDALTLHPRFQSYTMIRSESENLALHVLNTTQRVIVVKLAAYI